MLNADEVRFLETHIQFWAELNKEERNLIIANTSCKKYAKGKNLFSSGQECLGFVIVKSGKLRTYTLSDDGREVTFCRLESGSVCMLTASCALNTISVDIVIDVEEASEVFIISPQCIAVIIAQNVHAENFLLRAATEKLTEIIWCLQQILFMSMDKRLAVFLKDESARLASDEIKLTHEQIAKYMGSAREVVSRMLKYFEQEGIVRLQRGNIKIIDMRRLEAI